MKMDEESRNRCEKIESLASREMRLVMVGAEKFCDTLNLCKPKMCSVR